MSLDTLFTEAAEAGGPPRFTEDDIAHRVAGRHKRRRAVVTAAAVLVVVAGGALGVALAGRGGEGDVAGPGPTVEPVPVTADAILGSWSAIDQPDLTATFDEDGTYQVAGCTPTGGTWSIQDGDLALAEDHHQAQSCAPVGGVSLYTQLSLGVPTLYGDGVLRVVEGDTHTDLVRDGSEPPDPATPRTEAAGTLTVTPDLLRDTTWVADGVSLTFDDAAGFTWEDCSTGRGHWTVDDVGLYIDQLTRTGSNPCPPPDPGGRPDLMETLEGITLTTDGRLIGHGDGAVILTREDAATPASADLAAELTRSPWVTDGESAAFAGSAAWLELSEDGSFSASNVCGVRHGTWTATAEGAALTTTPSGTGSGCPIPDPSSADAIESVRLEGDTLVALSAPITDLATGEAAPFEQPLQRFDDLPVPTEVDLVGDWSSAWAPSAGYDGRTTVTFSGTGTVAVGGCPMVSSWTLTDDLLQLGDSVVDCVEDTGLGVLTPPLTVRINGSSLYLWSTDGDHIPVFVENGQVRRDTQLTVSGLEPSLLDAYADMGVEACCHEDLGSEDHVRHGFVWVGQQVLVQADLLGEPSGLEELPDPELSPDGRAVYGSTSEGPQVRFDCGGYRFTLSAWIRSIMSGHLLDAAVALADALPCDAEPPN